MEKYMQGVKVNLEANKKAINKITIDLITL